MRFEATAMLKIKKVDLERTHHEPETKPNVRFEANPMVTPAITMDTEDYGQNSPFQAFEPTANQPTNLSNFRYTIEDRAVACGERWIPAFAGMTGRWISACPSADGLGGAGMTEHGDVSYSGFEP